MNVSLQRIFKRCMSAYTGCSRFRQRLYDDWLVVGGLEHYLFFHSVGNVIIPTVTHSMIFQRGRAKNHQPDDDGREIRAGRILGLVSWPPAECMMSLALDSWDVYTLPEIKSWPGRQDRWPVWPVWKVRQKQSVLYLGLAWNLWWMISIVFGSHGHEVVRLLSNETVAPLH